MLIQLDNENDAYYVMNLCFIQDDGNILFARRMRVDKPFTAQDIIELFNKPRFADSWPMVSHEDLQELNRIRSKKDERNYSC